MSIPRIEPPIREIIAWAERDFIGVCHGDPGLKPPTDPKWAAVVKMLAEEVARLKAQQAAVLSGLRDLQNCAERVCDVIEEVTP